MYIPRPYSLPPLMLKPSDIFLFECSTILCLLVDDNKRSADLSSPEIERCAIKQLNNFLSVTKQETIYMHYYIYIYIYNILDVSITNTSAYS